MEHLTRHELHTTIRFSLRSWSCRPCQSCRTGTPVGHTVFVMVCQKILPLSPTRIEILMTNTHYGMRVDNSHGRYINFNCHMDEFQEVFDPTHEPKFIAMVSDFPPHFAPSLAPC